MKRINIPVTLTWLVALFVTPLPFLVILTTTMQTVYAQTPSMPIKLGIVAYAWMLAAVYLASRPRWLDRLIGLPTMYMIHGVLSVLAIAVSFLHQMRLPAEGLAKLSGSASLHLFMLVAIWSLITMAGWLSTRVPVIGKLRRSVERAFRHETNVWLHRLNLVAMALVVVHVHAIGFIYALKPFVLFFDVVTLVVALCVVREKFSRRHRYSGRLEANAQIAPNVRQLTIRVPKLANGWQRGDFAFIRFPMIPGMKELHPFSMVNEPNREGLMRFAIRGDGDFTKALASVPAGTDGTGAQVEVSGPFGRYERFLQEHDPKRPVVVYAGGIGVTPLIPVAMSAARDGRRVRFLYSAKTQQELLYADDLRRWRKATPNCELALRAGRFSDDELSAAKMDDAVYLIAGPSAMLRAIRSMLFRSGVRAGDICYEPFAW